MKFKNILDIDDEMLYQRAYNQIQNKSIKFVSFVTFAHSRILGI
jgi:hypothetical protein